MADPPFDIEHAHRWFAVELNNIAWNLVESPHRSPTDNERMINAAHAAFDRATAHGCASVAYASVGRMADARAEHRTDTPSVQADRGLPALAKMNWSESAA
jgi:hypothetical protein